MEKKEKVLLFGRGMVYQRKKDRLLGAYEIVAFLDNAVSREQYPVTDKETGIPVLNPADVVQYPEYPVILLSYALGSMCRQLLGLGVGEDRICFGPWMEPYNTFERMLFGDGSGYLLLDGGEVYYRNEGRGLYIQTDPDDLEKLTGRLKGTSLYPDASGILDKLPLRPLDDTYGRNRGTPVDRCYIEQFLEAHRREICGTVMEVGDREYTSRFGGRDVTDSVVLHVERGIPEEHQIKGNLATGEGLEEGSVDCFICTQTLPFIYDLHAAATHIMRVLKKGGTALITVGGISQIIQYERIHYGHYWGFTDQSLAGLFGEMEEVASVETVTYGNVKAATAFLYGISYEELGRDELDFRDPDYQLVIAAVVRKK